MAYSKAVEALLKRQKIQPGDRLRYSGTKGTHEGILLPKPETSGSEDVLLLKLDNGYNVGLHAQGATLEKLPGPAAALGNVGTVWKPTILAGVPKVSLVATGGTISTKVDYQVGGVYMLSEPAEILAKVPELAQIADIHRIESPFRKASEDMDHKDWQTLAKTVVDELNSDSQGVIVTHGTDILAYTAAALSFMIQNQNKPVAITGAQRSPDRGSADGPTNLMAAARFAASDCAEVAVVFHGSSNDDYALANAGTKCRKMHTSRRDAFQTVNAQPWAQISLEANGKKEKTIKHDASDPDQKKQDAQAVQFLRSDYRKRDNNQQAQADTAFEPKVAHIKPWPGADGRLVDFLVEQKFKGIVIEAWALGHLPATSKFSWVPNIQAAIDAGVTVCITSQSLYGKVHPSVYANLRKVSSTGALYVQDMLPETAWVKLAWTLGHTKNMEKIREMMLQNVAHEFNERHQQDDFPGFHENETG